MFQGTDDTMAVLSEVFGQLKHINDWCFTFFVTFNADIHGNIHTSKAQAITEEDGCKSLY